MKTSNQNDNSFEKNLICMIKELPEDTPPESMTLEVMSRLKEVDKSFLEKLINLFRHRITISFSPVKAVSVIILLIVGLLAIQTNFLPKKAVNTSGKMANINLPNHSSDYFMGRNLLTKGEYNKSIGFLKQAVALNPADSDYHFWLGVNYGNLKDYQNERISYIKAISLTSDHLMSNYFLGHSFMNDQKWDMALKAYDKTLTIQPTFEQALYNRGLALKHIGRNQEEALAWKNYLAIKNTGLWALRAAVHLNTSGDFSYRINQIGRQKMVIGPFLDNNGDKKIILSDSSLNSLGESLNLSPDLDLFVIVYSENNPGIAEYQAKNIKQQLLKNYPAINSARIKISWFGVGEEVSIGAQSFSLKHSVRFLGLTRDYELKGVST
jgi:tetratricopeptide (TPR) repeat protein